jgi:glutathione S-transferase
MLELWQTEWCPASRRVRQRLTELAVDYVVRQVPVERAERHALQAAAGADTIPALVSDGGLSLVGEEQILRWLEQRLPEPSGAEAHRVKAEKARRRYLEEECECASTPTPTA